MRLVIALILLGLGLEGYITFAAIQQCGFPSAIFGRLTVLAWQFGACR